MPRHLRFWNSAVHRFFEKCKLKAADDDRPFPPHMQSLGDGWKSWQRGLAEGHCWAKLELIKPARAIAWKCLNMPLKRFNLPGEYTAARDQVFDLVISL